MVVVLGALVAGTAWGQDDHFPFGPFRMYSTTNSPSGRITRIVFVGITEEGEQISIRSRQFGMRPAEVDGQVPRIRESPHLVRYLMEAYENANPDAPRLEEFRIVYGIHQLEDRVPVSYEERVVARWRR